MQLRGAALVLVLLSVPTGAAAQTRTPWQMNRGEGLVHLPSPVVRHGEPSEYAFATIPAATDPLWGPAPDPDLIDFSERSTLCGLADPCGHDAQFTYFRSVVCIPDPRDLGTLAVRIGSVDDGARVTVFNSAHPAGVTPSNGYAFLGGGTVTSGDFATDLRVGEPNTLVVTHVDDCCVESFLRDVTVLADGRPLPATVPRETCNGLDDDCNGAVDDGLGSTTCGVGQCRRTVMNCVGGETQRCVQGAPSPEVCNDLDDDCDGTADDGLGSTTCGVGACRRTVMNCVAGRTQVCAPGEPSPEVCNGVDDDCNGAVDDGIDCDGVLPEPPPDAPADAPAVDAAAIDACRDYLCDPSLRLEGRAGPIGDCTCRSAPGERAAGPGGWLAVLALTFVRRRRRGAR